MHICMNESNEHHYSFFYLLIFFFCSELLNPAICSLQSCSKKKEKNERRRRRRRGRRRRRRRRNVFKCSIKYHNSPWRIMTVIGALSRLVTCICASFSVRPESETALVTNQRARTNQRRSPTRRSIRIDRISN